MGKISIQRKVSLGELVVRCEAEDNPCVVSLLPFGIGERTRSSANALFNSVIFSVLEVSARISTESRIRRLVKEKTKRYVGWHANCETSHVQRDASLVLHFSVSV